MISHLRNSKNGQRTSSNNSRTGKRFGPVSPSKQTEQTMVRPTCVAAVLLLATATTLPAE
jgi:hypothetical protein